MMGNVRNLPNLLSAIRFVSVPILWVCAFLGLREYVGIGLLIGALTDMLDGLLARTTGQITEFGSKLDSIADQLLQVSAIFWVFMLLPEIIVENILLSSLALVVYGLSLSVGLIKFKRIANLHLYTSKISGVFLSLFLIHAFIVGVYSKPLFLLAAIGFIISSTETLILQLILPSVNERIGSIFFLFLSDDHPARQTISPKEDENFI